MFIFTIADLNIPETGEQLLKSNNGINTCCYRYCGSVYDGVCAHCEMSTTQNITAVMEYNQYYFGIDINKAVASTASLVCHTVITPTSKCTTPYYASSSSSVFKLTSSNTIINVHFWWTISWSFLMLIIINNNVAAWIKLLSYQLAGL